MSAHEIERPAGSTAPAPEEAPGLTERVPRLLLAHSPLGLLVRWVARLRASVHAKLLGAFLLIALLLIAMGVMSLQAIATVSHHSRLLDQARERVDAARQIEHALGLQMNSTRNALVLKDAAALESILREKNRSGDTLNRLEQAGPPGQRETIRRLQENLLVFYTGIVRSASAILKNQQAAVLAEKSKQKMLCRMMELARELKAELQKNNLDAFGEIIHANWELKKSITDEISTSEIDHWYQTARK